MPLTKVKPLSEFPPGSVEEVEAGGTSYALCNVDGKLYCLEGTCPHEGGPLGQGYLDGNYLVCPLHAWEYDCSTGVNDLDETVKVATFPVVVQDGNIVIDLP